MKQTDKIQSNDDDGFVNSAHTPSGQPPNDTYDDYPRRGACSLCGTQGAVFGECLFNQSGDVGMSADLCDFCRTLPEATLYYTLTEAGL